jgi:hypothetical protein
MVVVFLNYFNTCLLCRDLLPDWGLSWFSSVPTGKLWDNTFNYAQTTTFHIFSSALFTNHDELHNLYSLPRIIRMIKSRRMIWVEHVACMRISRTHIVFWWESQKPLGRPWYRWEDNIKMDVRDRGCWVWTGLLWLRIGTDGGLLRTWWWAIGFHKMMGNSWMAEWLNGFSRRSQLHRVSFVTDQSSYLSMLYWQSYIQHH